MGFLSCSLISEVSADSLTVAHYLPCNSSNIMSARTPSDSVCLLFAFSASLGDERTSAIWISAAVGSLTQWLGGCVGQDGAGGLPAWLSHPAGPQAALPRDPRRSGVAMSFAGTCINPKCVNESWVCACSWFIFLFLNMKFYLVLMFASFWEARLHWTLHRVYLHNIRPESIFVGSPWQVVFNFCDLCVSPALVLADFQCISYFSHIWKRLIPTWRPLICVFCFCLYCRDPYIIVTSEQKTWIVTWLTVLIHPKVPFVKLLILIFDWHCQKKTPIMCIRVIWLNSCVELHSIILSGVSKRCVDLI